MVSSDFLLPSRSVDDEDDDITETASTMSSSSSATAEDDLCLLICQSLQDLEICQQDRFTFVKDLGIASHRIVSALKNRFLMSDHLTELEQCITEFAATVFLEYSGTCKPRGYFATSIDRRLQHETLGDLQELELFLDEIGDKDALSHTDKERLGIFRRSFRGSCDQVKIWSGLSGTHSYSVASAVLGQANVPVPVASTEYTATGPSLHGISPARADEINQIQEDANLASLIDAQEWEEWAIEAREQAVPARRSKQNETNCQRTRVSPSKTTIQPSGNGHHYYYHATPSTNVQSSWDASAFLSPVFVPPLRTSFHTTVHTASRSGASSSQTVSYNSHNTSFTNIRNSFNNP